LLASGQPGRAHILDDEAGKWRPAIPFGGGPNWQHYRTTGDYCSLGEAVSGCRGSFILGRDVMADARLVQTQPCPDVASSPETEIRMIVDTMHRKVRQSGNEIIGARIVDAYNFQSHRQTRQRVTNNMGTVVSHSDDAYQLTMQ
jgi:hypothetical protein